MMKHILSTVFTAGTVLFLLLGCTFNNPPAAVDESPGYYARELELSTWIDEAETVWKPVENRVYNEAGRLTAVSKHKYERMTEAGYEYYMNTRTDVYEVDREGSHTFVEYYLYTYHPDYYEYVDDDGNEFVDVDYLLLRGETRTPDDVLRYYYDTVYDAEPADGDFTTPDYDYYTSIIDKRDSDGASTAEQYATYVTDPDGGKHFRTEKYYVRKEDDSGLEFSKEFASWYDTAVPYDYLYDLYHSFRGETAGDEFYYFTRYSRNDTGNIYEQADYEYNADTLDKIGSADHTNGTFNDTDAAGWPLGPYDENVVFDKIGSQATVLRTEYDERGNITLDERWYRGELVEYTKYTYNGDSELTDQNRYTQGGSLLRDRKTARFRDQVIYGKDYSVKETCEYKYYDYSDTESQSDDAASRGLSRMMRPKDSCKDLDDLQLKHLYYSRLNNNYRK